MKLTLSLSLALGILQTAFAQDTMTVAPTPSNTGESDVPSMSPSMTPVKPTLPPTGSAGCYDSLDDVMLVIEDDSLLFVQKDIILCPNTVYDVGFRQGAVIVNGQSPIVPRSNLLIKCGEDGSSANGCILRGGHFAIFQIPIFFISDPVATNIVFQGLTIEEQIQYGVLYTKTGDVQFIDCIVQNIEGSSPVLVPYTTTRATRRLEEQLREDGISGWEAADIYLEHLKDVEQAIRDNDQRFLSGEFAENPFSARESERQAQEVSELDLTFVGSKFVNNIQKYGGQPAVVTVFGGATNLVMEDCEFSGNMYADPNKSPVGYALLTQQSVAALLKNICISENDFLGEGAVVFEMPFHLTTEGIYVDGDSSDVMCPFAALVADDDIECVEADLATCALDVTAMPVAPVHLPAPTESPSPAPSQASTCADCPEDWYDSDGPEYDCEWYGGSSTRCYLYGDSFSNFGATANEACCVCGGGCSTDAPRTEAPTMSPISIQIHNNGFERDNNKWKEISGEPTRECGMDSAYRGDCAYAFYGARGIQSRIKNKASRVEGGSVGDTFTLTFYAKGVDLPAKNAFKAFVKIKGSEPTKVYKCKSSQRGTFEYTKMSCSFTMDRDFEKMFIYFSYGASTGALYLDRIGLEVLYAAVAPSSSKTDASASDGISKADGV